MAPARSPEIRDKDIQGTKYLKAFDSILQVVRDRQETKKTNKERKLHFDHYVGLLLFYFFTPILTSLRSIQRVSELKKVQKALGCSRSALG